jgi:hypothetical protein
MVESVDSEVSVKRFSYNLKKPNFMSDANICSTVLMGSTYPGSIRNVVRYAWNTVLIATL